MSITEGAWEDPSYVDDVIETMRATITAQRDTIANLRRQIDEADGLWRHWKSVDITEDDDRWAAFSNAVDDHLRGKPVDERFVMRGP